MKSPEEYRALAAQSLHEAEALPEGLRLNHIVVAQLWLELADKITQLRLEIEVNDPPSEGSAPSQNATTDAATASKPLL